MLLKQHSIQFFFLTVAALDLSCYLTFWCSFIFDILKTELVLTIYLSCNLPSYILMSQGSRDPPICPNIFIYLMCELCHFFLGLSPEYLHTLSFFHFVCVKILSCVHFKATFFCSRSSVDPPLSIHHVLSLFEPFAKTLNSHFTILINALILVQH